MSMDSATWNRVASLFDELSELPTVERRRRLESVQDPEVRGWLMRLLSAHDATEPSLLDEVLEDVVDRMAREDEVQVMPARAVGMEFGNWRAVETIDRGGMGVVVRGERADGEFDKQVAIKLLPPGPIGADMRNRFQTEIRALAQLEHPNIAHLIDGGINAEGIPYLVMELVDGVPVDEYCRGRDRRQCVRLMKQLVEAVAFCHRHLIVHADIKPSNVLVTSDGLVKLVDFGVGVMLSDSSRTGESATAVRCSPAHAAPERLAGEAPTIPQDIYALGAVLYQLLSGNRLRDARQMTALVFGDREESVARGTKLPDMTELPADLQAICQRALAADPGPRYGSADALGADLSDWLALRPVAARGGGRMYRTGRWLRRQWIPATAVGATMLALITGSGVALWQAQEAHRQAAAAEASNQRADLVREFLVELFDASDPDASGGRVPDARELLDAGTRRAREAFPDSPLLKAELLLTLARINRKLGSQETAAGLLASALAATGPDDAGLRWRLYNQQAVLALNRGEPEAALEILDRVSSELGGSLDARARNYLDITRIQALWRVEGQSEAAHALGREVLNRPVIRRGDSPVAVLAHSTVLGQLIIAGRLDEAMEVGEVASRLATTVHASPSRRIAIYNNLASAYRRNGDRNRAIELRQRALEQARRAYPRPHFQRAYVAASLGGNMAMVGRFDEAGKLLEEALAEYDQIYDEPNLRTAAAHSNFGLLLSLQERHTEAIPHFRMMVDVYTEQLGADHPQTLVARANLGSTLSRMGSHADAEDELREVLRLRREHFGDGHPAVLRSESVLVRHYLDSGDPGKALELAGKVLTDMREEFPEGHHRMTTVQTYRAAALGRLGRRSEADQLFDSVITKLQAGTDRNWMRFLEIVDRYSRFLHGHDPVRADETISSLLDDPGLADLKDHPAWLRIRARMRDAGQLAGPSRDRT